MAGAVGLRDVRYGYAGENHLGAVKDESNPYFTFDASKCIVCSRCVRACEEVQGTFALTIDGRGFASKVSAGREAPSSTPSASPAARACRRARPRRSRRSRSSSSASAERTVLTTCAYCGVGCSFKAELRGDEVVRMVPYKDGGANEGHSLREGPLRLGLRDPQGARRCTPLMRESIDDEWREVSLGGGDLLHRDAPAGDPGRSTASTRSAPSPRRAAPTKRSSRCRRWSARRSGSNNVDTCARVCHSPTGYGLKQTFGTSAGTQDFASVDEADVIVVIGANPTDAHPVFALADEAPAARGCRAHRRRPAPHRPRAHRRTSRPTTTSSSTRRRTSR